LARRLGAALALAALASGAIGCGSGGVAKDATLSVYVEAPLCVAAKRELASENGRAGSFRIQITCLPSAHTGNRLNLATIGADARRATEDATSIGYLAAPDTARFSRPILETPGIPRIYGNSGTAAMARLLHAIQEAGSSGSLRDSVAEALHET
jgi:hypothetical protein